MVAERLRTVRSGMDSDPCYSHARPDRHQVVDTLVQGHCNTHTLCSEAIPNARNITSQRKNLRSDVCCFLFH
jgi:hypothetical protein